MRAILTYHSIDDSGSAISCTRQAFDQHVAWLASGKVQVLSVADLISASSSDNAIAITFDDAFANFGEYAAPRLIAHGLPVTVFAVTSRVGGTNEWDGNAAGIPRLPLLGWDGLATLSERGVAIGSHTQTHPDLTTLRPSAIAEEIQGSADVIASTIGVRPTLFAYPYGRMNDAVAKVVGRAYQHACTTEFEVIDGGVRAEWLPRLDAFYFQQPGVLETWGTPTFSRFVARRHRLRRIRRAAQTTASRLVSWSHR
jgi:peptidoglycan/xylan/chitin deacetylase (PgdA/CDA1 family)